VREFHNGTEHQTYITRPRGTHQRLWHGWGHPPACSPGPCPAGIGNEGNLAGRTTCHTPCSHVSTGRFPPPWPKCPHCWHSIYSTRGEPGLLSVPEQCHPPGGGYGRYTGVCAIGGCNACWAARPRAGPVCSRVLRNGQIWSPSGARMLTAVHARSHPRFWFGRNEAGYGQPNPQLHRNCRHGQQRPL
jgi:hypothetical protein